MSIIKNKDGSFSKIPDFDPAQEATDLAQKIAAVELQRQQGHAQVDAEADATLAQFQEQVSDIQAAAALDPKTASDVQPILETSKQQYPSVAKALIP